MELGCALMENLIQLFDEELFQNQNLQCPIIFHAITLLISLSSREMVESPRERLTRITKETRRELEEREGKEKKCNTCIKEEWASIPREHEHGRLRGSLLFLL